MLLAGYLCVFFASWIWSARLGYDEGGTLTAFLAIASLAEVTIPQSGHHPSDTFGTAIFTLTLAALTAGRHGAAMALCLAAGFLWKKHILIAPIIFVYYALRGNWRRAATLGLASGVLSLVGSLVYGAWMGPHRLTSEGVLAPDVWLAQMPRSLILCHVPFAAPSLVAMAVRRSRVPAIVAAAMVAYPAILGLYAAQRLFMYEMRSFWIVIPIFAAVLGSLARRDDPAGQSPGSDTNRLKGDGPVVEAYAPGATQ